MDTMVELLLNESTLVDRAKTDPSAFGQLYDWYFPRVYNYVRYRVRYAESADEITALTFEHALAKLSGYRPDRGQFADWLFAIARNCVRDHDRGIKRRRWLSLETLSDQPGEDLPPEDIVIRNEERALLMEAVGRLSDREQEVIALRFAAGLTNRSIAGLCGLKEGNVAVILHRSVKKLRTMLSDWERE